MTSRTGLGAKAGHDLTLGVERWAGTATVDITEPARSSVNIEADVDSIRVVEGTGGVKPLTDGDRSEIENTLRTKILHASQHPSIAFQSTAVAGSMESFTVEGELTISGVTNTATLSGSIAGDRARGGTTVAQSRWGIKPYTAFFGALKLADEVRVEFDVSLAR